MSNCQYVESRIYYWGGGFVDKSEPEYVRGKGVPIEDGIACHVIADPGEKYCPRHKMMVEMTQVSTEG